VQVAPEQHPPAQLAALQPLHTPPAQVCVPQFWQAAPPLPQAVPAVPDTQVVPEQQPLGQDAPSQTQMPLAQRWPAAHGAPAPHEQLPLRQRSAVIPHVAQAPPPLPHADSEGERHAPAEQHPPAQDTLSQVHRPATQCWPVAHSAPAPHAQVPVAAQLSAVSGSQVTQAAPPLPQVDGDGALQVVPAQHPLGHEPASHTQVPPAQRWPTAQAGCVPQAHCPAAEQLSARTASQPVQVAPAVPQVATEGGLHVAPEQQPFGQVVPLQPLHTPPTHNCAPGQLSHAPPPVPHDVALLPGRQAPAAQHPPAHEVPSHTQVLAMQRCPGAHALALPQWQLPPAEQLSDRSSHAVHVEPEAPQLVRERVSHTAPRQHPLGHEVASQTQSPPLQRWPPAHDGPSPHAQLPFASQ
jgi:hypothetical protein